MKTTTSEIKITGQPTLDPSVCKFVVEHPIFPDGSVVCRNKEMAEGSPLLEALFAIDGIREILVTSNILTIAKESDESWPETGRKIGAAIREVIKSGRQLIDPGIRKKLPSEEKIRETIEKLFEDEVNPAIASHGGRVELADVDGTKVYLRLGGGCQGCSSATVTLRQGIEKAIRAVLPDVTEIHDVTDHAAGTDPYFK
jgi:Fe-S cluster biogenesis protein NfuA